MARNTNVKQGMEYIPPVTNYAASGALTMTAGIHCLTKAGVGAMTLAAATAVPDGTEMLIISTTAQAHTVTYTAGFNGGSTSTDVATFGGAIGDNFKIVAKGGIWLVEYLRNVTLG